MLIYLLYLALSPIFLLLILLVMPFIPKIRKRYMQQWSVLRMAMEKIHQVPQKKLLLLHAASAGEFEQLKPILSLLDRKKYFLLQSFSSPTIYEKEHDNPLFDTTIYLPVDFPWSAHRFFNKIRPEKFVMTRHDLWPNLLVNAGKAGVQRVLINANLHSKSQRSRWYGRYFHKWLFSQIDQIMVPSQNLENNWRQFVATEKVQNTGDSRFDQVLQRKKTNEDKPFLPKEFEDKQNILFGSVIESDAPVLARGLAAFFPSGDDSLERAKLRLIIVPHEVDSASIQFWQSLGHDLQMSTQLFSELNDNQTIPSVLIVDKVGILADLYRYSRLAYVGAGFGAGVHSVIEPAVYKNMLAFGPNYHILDEAEQMVERNIASVVRKAEDLVIFFNLLYQSDQLEKGALAVGKFVEQNAGASKRIVDAVFNEKT